MVETYHNWRVDLENDFKFLGIDIRKLKNKNLQTGDILITYISKIKKIVDARKIIDVNICKTPISYSYDRFFENSIKTQLITLLDEDKWIPYSVFSKKVELFAIARKPGMIFLNAPVKISEYDFRYFANLMNLGE